MFTQDKKYNARKKRAESFKLYGFEKSSAGRVSGMLGAMSGVRKGCNCCDLFGVKERRRFKRIELDRWRKDWQDEKDSELREMTAFDSFE